MSGAAAAVEMSNLEVLLAEAWDCGYEAGSKWDSGDNPYREDSENA